jgi:hypothetical protein
LIQAVSLAATALNLPHGRASASRSIRQCLAAEVDRTTEIALLKEELDTKDARWRRLPSRRRPDYTPVQRMRILQLKAARGWSCEQAARAFLIDQQTLRSWMRRVDEEGERSLHAAGEVAHHVLAALHGTGLFRCQLGVTGDAADGPSPCRNSS